MGHNLPMVFTYFAPAVNKFADSFKHQANRRIESTVKLLLPEMI